MEYGPKVINRFSFYFLNNVMSLGRMTNKNVLKKNIHPQTQD